MLVLWFCVWCGLSVGQVPVLRKLKSSHQFTGKYIATSKSEKAKFPLLLDNFQDDIEKLTNARLYSGSVQSDISEIENLDTNVEIKAAIKYLRVAKPELRDWKIVKARKRILLATGDGGQSQLKGEFKDENGVVHYEVNYGYNLYLTFVPRKGKVKEQHLVLNYDTERRFNIIQHTGALLANELEADEDNCDRNAKYSFRIMSYNVWNVNPGNDVFGEQLRWRQYTKRMDWFAKNVKNAMADIIGFQEVRHDNTFGDKGRHHQIKHLATRLHGYQFVYQPAMTYLNSNKPLERIEEGPAIFSRYPIIHSDYLLMSRDEHDGQDVHQRVCLHGVISVPHFGNIDVYVTHLSLSEKSRENTMLEIWEYMQKGKGVAQLLLGDLNAEPQSRGIQFLQGFTSLHGQKTDLRDAFLDIHTEPVPKSLDMTDRVHKFTFPAHNPIKRIDFILYRGKGKTIDFKVIGQEPTKETVNNPNYGMTHPYSPIWPSDHRGVYADIK